MVINSGLVSGPTRGGVIPTILGLFDVPIRPHKNIYEISGFFNMLILCVLIFLFLNRFLLRFRSNGYVIRDNRFDSV
ncbi:p9 [Beet pseudoyellows virus]|uniref:p9 n=1 Tax=Beet pseudoyellows virus TaxID=72750 RepID=Q6VRA6_9CLOS|nr:p9 [Beet pseudoyellows virus]AAQ97385.1 p9 [Beet pseudoyellows virus]